MDRDTLALCAALAFLLLVFVISLAALHLAERQKINGINEIHKRTIEAAKQMQWQSGEKPAHPQGEGE